MKQLHRNIKISLCLFIFSASLHASVEAVVTSLKGDAFLIYENQSIPLTAGMKIPENAEVMTSENSQATLTDFYDHHLILSPSTHVQVLNRLLELRGGSVWIQSQRKSDSYLVQTANALTMLDAGEVIVYFDPAVGLSQVLGIAGVIRFQSQFGDDPGVKVRPGEFSMVHKDQTQFRARPATMIGEASFRQVVGVFNGVQPLHRHTLAYNFPGQEEENKRVPASWQGEELNQKWGVSNAKTGHVRSPSSEDSSQGKIILLKRKPAVEEKPKFDKDKFYEETKQELKRKRLKKNPRVYDKKANVSIRVFGQEPTATESRPTRLPASVVAPAARSLKTNTDADFKGSLVDQYKSQMRYSSEVNELMDRLKSIEIDHRKDYKP
jgi:hypothetical protein